MNIFTNDDYRRIQAWLKANAIKDSDFAISENTVPDEDILVITQNMSTVPTNHKIKIKDLLNSSLGKVVIDKIIAKAVTVNNVLTVDAANVVINNDKGETLQDIIDWCDDIEASAKGWKIEYQDPQQDEPTVRAKYVLKDYKGVPKGNVIKVYKDSAITNVYLGTTEDTCNPDTGEVTKKPIHDNNEALSIVYRLDTGKYMLVNVPLGIFTREAEFDKYRGLGIEPNGQVFIKLASDVESTNYLHFNSLGELAADGIEARILRDLGTLISSVAGDGTMWGQYKQEEGTQETSTPNDGSRWGEYKEAEAHRDALSNSNNIVYHEDWDDSEGPEWIDPVTTESNIAYNWKTADTPASDGKSTGNLKDLYQKTLDTDVKVAELEQEINEKDEINLISNVIKEKYIAEDGVIESQVSAYCISDYIEIENIKKVNISASGNWGNGLYAFYDGTKQYISGTGYYANGTDTMTTLSNEEVIVPNNAKYLVVAWRETSVIGAAINKINISKFEIQQNKINKLNQFVESETTELPSEIVFTSENKKVISQNGSIVGDMGADYCISELIPIDENKVIITACSHWGRLLCAFYRTEDTSSFISGITSSEGSAMTTLVNKEIPVPNYAKYVRVAFKKDVLLGKVYTYIKISRSKRNAEKINFSTKEKTWFAIGDSLTDVNTLGANKPNYTDIVSEMLDLKMVNKGVGGTGYWRGHKDNNAFYQRVAAFTENEPDIITIFGSFNDLGTELGVTGSNIIGLATDTGTDTIGGCINTTIDNLTNYAPDAVIGIITPTQWSGYYNNANAIKYVRLLEDIAKLRGIPVLNLFYTSNLRPDSDSFRNAYYLNADGVHPNTEGHKRFSGQIANFVQSICKI